MAMVAAVSDLTGKSRRRREEEQIIALGGKVGLYSVTVSVSLSLLLISVNLATNPSLKAVLFSLSAEQA